MDHDGKLLTASDKENRKEGDQRGPR